MLGYWRQPDKTAEAIGVPDIKYGEDVMAWVQLRDGSAPLTAGGLREFCSGKIANYKIPRYVHVVDEFPVTVTGKIRKVEMRERSIQLLGLDTNPAPAAYR